MKLSLVLVGLLVFASISLAASVQKSFTVVVDRTSPSTSLDIYSSFSNNFHVGDKINDETPSDYLVFIKFIKPDDYCDFPTTVQDLIDGINEGEWLVLGKQNSVDKDNLDEYTYPVLSERGGDKFYKINYPDLSQYGSGAFKVCILTLDKIMDLQQAEEKELNLTNPEYCRYYVIVETWNPIDESEGNQDLSTTASINVLKSIIPDYPDIGYRDDIVDQGDTVSSLVSALGFDFEYKSANIPGDLSKGRCSELASTTVPSKIPYVVGARVYVSTAEGTGGGGSISNDYEDITYYFSDDLTGDYPIKYITGSQETTTGPFKNRDKESIFSIPVWSGSKGYSDGWGPQVVLSNKLAPMDIKSGVIAGSQKAVEKSDDEAASEIGGLNFVVFALNLVNQSIVDGVNIKCGGYLDLVLCGDYCSFSSCPDKTGPGPGAVYSDKCALDQVDQDFIWNVDLNPVGAPDGFVVADMHHSSGNKGNNC